jgi:hypothetical protein
MEMLKACNQESNINNNVILYIICSLFQLLSDTNYFTILGMWFFLIFVITVASMGVDLVTVLQIYSLPFGMIETVDLG